MATEREKLEERVSIWGGLRVVVVCINFKHWKVEKKNIVEDEYDRRINCLFLEFVWATPKMNRIYKAWSDPYNIQRS